MDKVEVEVRLIIYVNEINVNWIYEKTEPTEQWRNRKKSLELLKKSKTVLHRLSKKSRKKKTK